MTLYRVDLTVVGRSGVEELTLHVESDGHFGAESEAHLVATEGEGLIVLTIDSVAEAAEL